ncbi:MAG: tol-pal system protein YbgF [Deltaproteobacteria bacterium]|nr:tol-pal system protein YbgF [Deltaproteobacteria bacterium]
MSGRRSKPALSSSVGMGPVGQGGFEELAPDNLGVVSQQGVAGQDDSTMNAFHEAYRNYSNKRYDEALAKFSSFIHDNSQHPYADNAVFWRGECHLAKGKFFKAIGEFERLFRRYPKSEKVPSGLYRAGFAYDQLRDRAKALEYYFRVVDKHPGTDAARRASLRVSAIEGKGGRVSNLLPTAAKR